MLVLNTVGNSGMRNMILSTNFAGIEGHCCKVACMVNTAGYNTVSHNDHFWDYSCADYSCFLSYSCSYFCYRKNYFCSSHCSSVGGFDFCRLGIVCSSNCRSSLLEVVDGWLPVDVFLRYAAVTLPYTHNCLAKDEPGRPLVELGDLDNCSCNNLGFHSNYCMGCLSLRGCCCSCSQH